MSRLLVEEFGQENQEVIMLLHGGGLSWWNYREEAELLKENYHVILPVLDGHADSKTPFTTIEENAKELIEYIDENFQGRLLAIGGLSLGGQILTEMISQRSDICQYAIIESALVIPMPMTAAMISPIMGISYGLISKDWFAKMQFRQLKIKSDLFEDYYEDTCKITKQNMIYFLKANASYTLKPELPMTTAKVLILAGSREKRRMLQSAEALHNVIMESELKILDHFNHGELSLNHAKEYTELLTDWISA